VAAQALEQSVLESKDKEQLLAIAKALGLKASARSKKADIIDQILEMTGSTDVAASTAAPARTSNGSHGSAEPQATDEPAAPAAEASSSNDTPAEPPAEWELAVGDDTSTDDAGSAAAPTGDDTGHDDTGHDDTGHDDTGHDDTGHDDTRADRAQPQTTDTRPADGSGSQRRNGQQRNAGQQSGNQGNQGNQQGGARTDTRTDTRGDDGDGESRSRRRRRRRKGGRGPDGPQGDDRDLLEQDAPAEPVSNEPVPVSGYLDLRDEGYGFLRVSGFLPSRDDSYIPVKLSRQYGLRKGDHITGLSRPAGRNEKNPALLEIYTINGGEPEAMKRRPRFEDLTALFPDSRLHLENPTDPTDMTARIIDLVSPIGKGQRGIIVSPPKAGKTTVMKTIATAIEHNNPEVKLMVLLIDERPEEVTDMRRTVKGEVVSSTFDRPSDEHTHVAEMTIERAKRMVEMGDDVVIILDGITRLSRAYNLAAPASGRILSGGIDAGALYPPKKFFGAARNVEEGGSLTILATALVETNSRMDDAIFEEFKGTGNMELRLDRRLAERRIYPAIDVDASSTRHEELLFDRKQLQMVWKLRRVLSGLAADGNAAPGLELLIDRLKTFRTNDEFLNEIAKQPSM
jgi:transcription termination factor Rho